MTVILHIGRRVPRSWYRRTATKVKGLMTFQENIWQMIIQSLNNAKKKANEDGRMKFVITKDIEFEDMNYQLEWRKVIIQGTPEMELEEYNDCMRLYTNLSKSFKKEFDVDDRLSKHFKSKFFNAMKVEEAYKEGYGALENNNIANKLLEMGILTHIEWTKDFDSRDDSFLFNTKPKKK
jgi:hypothetical protein